MPQISPMNWLFITMIQLFSLLFKILLKNKFFKNSNLKMIFFKEKLI